MEDIAAFLAKTVLLSVLPPATLPAIARAATRVTLAKGEVARQRGSRRRLRAHHRHRLVPKRGRTSSGRAGVGVTPVRAPPGLGGRLRILAIAMRAMELASQEHVARSLPLIDVLVRPELEGFSSADLEGAAEMCARGESAAEAAMPAILDAQPAAVTR